LAPGETRTVAITVSGTLPGRHVVTAEVTATSGRFREVVTADLELTAASTLVDAFNNVGIGDDGRGNADFDGGGFYYSRQNLAAKGVVAGRRLPVPGTDLTYELAAVPAGRPDNVIAGGQRIDLSGVPANATRLSFVGAAVVGDAAGGRATLTFTDGTTQQTPLEFGDWCLGGDPAAPPRFGNIGIVQGDYRDIGAGTQPVRCWLFSTAPVDLPAGKRVANVTLPTVGNLHVFAVADNGTR
jgi:hypothetical protein